ncbi:inositol hexakisphosphate and diphosphoinositol-pentakisphosphate kinase isoform X5 [Episyrphus balteatus]|uniref:inositol hexakisphosphate and diphosphoinositol-pentakisphosphate kinase isoform X5 n=1 Tax=Episyrphus balteatus TaxID=286459 RepID=UPI0024859EAB|nr:inositol hexakisphosphate and diphosphoinositol-pentakisphosphate kinase isoform X5 [Episyrphus balteatus]
MEWSWLKDWWRLKNLNRRRRRRVHDSSFDPSDVDSVKSDIAHEHDDEELGETDDICYCDDCLNGDIDMCGESNDGMDSDCSISSCSGKQVVVGVCAMSKKTQSKPMKEILTRLQEFEYIKMVVFEEDVILKEPVDQWQIVDCLISFHSKGFPLEKAIQYAQLRRPFVINNLHMQYDIQDRRRVYAILESEGIEIPRYAVLDRDSPDPKQHELIESEDHVEVNGVTFNKPFVEKPVSAEDHNIYIYYPTSAGGGSQRLFRKVKSSIHFRKQQTNKFSFVFQIGSRSSVYSPESRVRKTGSFIYEDFMPTDGTDVKVYTVGPDYAHAEARKSPALDGKVERDSEGKEIRYPVILNNAEKLISRKVCLAFKQTVCGFDLLRANGKSYVCDVNGFSFVKNSNKYYDDCAKILGNMILRELTPTLHIPWSVPFQLDDPPIVPTTFGKMMELRCVVAVIRHGDRTPKQKMKVEVRHPKFFEIFEKYDGYKHGHVKLKRPKQLQEILDIARSLLAEIQTKAGESEIEEKQGKLEQLKSVLEMYGHFSGINRKVQMKYQPKGRPRGSSSDEGAPKEPSLVLILKWGGELTPAGRIQAEELGRIFRCMYPGGQGRHDYSGTQGLGLLRLHSTFRHDLKIYASDEGRVQMTAAAFAKGLLALEGELTPILVQMVKSANTNGLLDNDCDSSKYQNMAKNRLHELMQIDRDFTKEDREAINPGNSISINQAMDFVKNPVKCCAHVHSLIQELMSIISVKKDDPKTKDAILYHGETWDLMGRRWEKIEKDFSTKSKQFDISKIPDIYDCIKYDLQHNQHTLQYDQAEELYIYAKYLADIVIPQEYGLTIQEKLTIGQGICTPLLKKIKADLQRNIEEVGEESVNRLNPRYSHGVSSPGRHVRTRLYFTSESHVHSLLTVLRYGGLLNVLTDEQWRRAMDYISMVSELNYMSQIVIMLYEDPTKDPCSEERFHVELHFSPGVNCCVQKNLPPGPGFRPHSRNDSAHSKNITPTVGIRISQSPDDTNPTRIDEENDLNLEETSPVHSKPHSEENSPEEQSELAALPKTEIRSKHLKSKPIPIGSHHTVSGHEAQDLAKRLNEELASQQAKQSGSLEVNRAISPDGEPRSRSFEQRHHQKTKEEKNSPEKVEISKFNEIINVRHSNKTPIQIRVSDSVAFFKIDSSTNELPLSDIDFSQNPCTPDTLMSPPKHPLAIDDVDETSGLHFHRKRHSPKISPLATNERPLSYTCLTSLSCADNINNLTENGSFRSRSNVASMHSLGTFHCALSSPPSDPAEFVQLSCSAPAAILTHDIECQIADELLTPDIPIVHAKNFDSISPLKKFEADAAPSNPLTKPPLSGGGSKKLTRHLSHDDCPLLNGKSVLVPLLLEPDPNSSDLTPAIVSLSDFNNLTTTTPELSSCDCINTANNTNICCCLCNPPLSSSVSMCNMSYNVFASNLLTKNDNKNTHHESINATTSTISIPTTPTTTKTINKNDIITKLTNTPTAKLLTMTTTTNYDKLTTIHHNHHKHQQQLLLANNKTKPHHTNIKLTTTTDNATSTSSSSSASSRRQRHSIAGQMTYMKMLGFGGFGKKMATSTNSLFSTAVISGSSSAPNLRDMIPSTATPSAVLEGFGGVPPIRPLETLHNALSLKQLDVFLEKMTVAPLFKTPASSPPKNPSTPIPTPSQATSSSIHLPIDAEKSVTTPTNLCNEPLGGNDLTTTTTATNKTTGCPLNDPSPCDSSKWSTQSSIASSTEPSSPAISDSCYSHGTPSGEMSMSLTSTDGLNVLPTAEELAKFFPQLDDDLNSVYVQLNSDNLDPDVFNPPTEGEKSCCLTPVSMCMDLSTAATKGSITLSIENEDEDEATLSAATTPSLPPDEFSPHTIESEIYRETERFELRPPARKPTDPISPKIQKQISLFEREPSPSSPRSPPQVIRRKKFDNVTAQFLTQSASNSNFKNFESNTLQKKSKPDIGGDGDDDEESKTRSCSNLKTESISSLSQAAQKNPGAVIVKEIFIEPPRRISRSFHGKTQSMDAGFLFSDFLNVPSTKLTRQGSVGNEGANANQSFSANTSPSARARFTTSKVDDNKYRKDKY